MSDLNSLLNKNTNNITLEKMALRGLSIQMAKRFNLKREPIFVSSSDKWNTINNLRKQKDSRTEFPFMTFKMQSMEINSGSYSPKSLFRIGQPGAGNDSNNMMYKNEPIPTNITLEVTFLTDDFYAMVTFANKWLYASITKSLNMELEFDGVFYGIQCEPEANVSVPEKDMSVEQANVYEFVSTIIIHGYISPDRPLDEFPQVYPVTKFVVTPKMMLQDDTGGFQQIDIFPEDSTDANILPDGIHEGIVVPNPNPYEGT